MSKLIFIDTETTSLRRDRRAWEIGLIIRRNDRDLEGRWFIDIDDLDLGNADLKSLEIGRFYERHPQMNGRESADVYVDEEADALRRVEELTRGAHLVGAVPNFDADVLDRRMRAHGILPSWHYHLVDIEALAVGYLHAKGLPHWGDPEASANETVLALPWRSTALYRAIGVDPDQYEAHTALGDARLVRGVYDAITEGTP